MPKQGVGDMSEHEGRHGKVSSRREHQHGTSEPAPDHPEHAKPASSDHRGARHPAPRHPPPTHSVRLKTDGRHFFLAPSSWSD
jgi:hypothetical protein